MVIEEKPGYAARLADCAEEASRRFLRRLGMGWGRGTFGPWWVAVTGAKVN
jgi:hypothetical protein